MIDSSDFNSISPGDDCRRIFKNAYENRYTWDSDFQGYKGEVSYINSQKKIDGVFLVDKDLKNKIDSIEDEDAKKSISSQLFEVAIHRVRRSFDDTHGQNTFKAGDINSLGLEVLVGGKNSGDAYRIKDNIVTMVRRNIHGSLIIIETIDVFDTGSGYLSRTYTSQYLDPKTHKLLSLKRYYEDEFVELESKGIWVLSSRVVHTDKTKNNSSTTISFKFSNLKKL